MIGSLFVIFVSSVRPIVEVLNWTADGRGFDGDCFIGIADIQARIYGDVAAGLRRVRSSERKSGSRPVLP